MKHINTMNTDIHSQAPTGQLPEVARDTTDAAEQATNTTPCTAKDIYQSASLKACEALETSKEYVRRNPVPVVFGAIAIGATIGYLLMVGRRKPTFSERYGSEPLAAVREAVLGALAPMAELVHKGYDSARDGAGKAFDRAHRFSQRRSVDSFSDRIKRIGNNLKFW